MEKQHSSGQEDKGRSNTVERQDGDRSGYQNQRRNKSSSIKTTKFKGNCKDLTDHVYDVGLSHGNQDLFANITREIAKYVDRE